MSGRGIPEAESDDQSWMNPEVPKKLPVAEYNEFNPPPVVKSEQQDEYERQIRKSLRSILIGVVLLALALYLFLN